MNFIKDLKSDFEVQEIGYDFFSYPHFVFCARRGAKFCKKF